MLEAITQNLKQAVADANKYAARVEDLAEAHALDPKKRDREQGKRLIDAVRELDRAREDIVTEGTRVARMLYEEHGYTAEAALAYIEQF